jgi:ferrochelatase
MSKGVLLVNLGSPDSPSVSDVRRYLSEFLMDPRVLDVPWPVRFCVVHFGILPTRPKQASHAYQSIWTKDGSPLVAISRRVLESVQKRVRIPVALAMRYQNPTIESALAGLREQHVDDLLLIPLFPQFAMSSFETAVERVKEVAARVIPGMRLQVQAPFGSAPGYISALLASASDYLKQDYDHLLFSFHGLPERHIRKADPTGTHCLHRPDCCQVSSPAHATCYRAQCFATVKAFVEKAHIPREKYSVAFQSRLGRDPWLSPYTDHELAKFPGRGVKKLFVICPAFVSDCLETLEEIGIRGRDTFLQAGGKEFAQIPCMNEHPLWIEALEGMIGRFVEEQALSATAPAPGARAL